MGHVGCSGSVYKIGVREVVDVVNSDRGVDFYNITTAQKNTIQNVILHRVDSQGLSAGDFKIENKTIIIKNKFTLSQNDLLRTYSIPIINRTDIVIGNLSAQHLICFNDDCTRNETRSNWVDNGDGTWNITFDPTVTIDDVNYLSNANFVNTSAAPNVTHLDFVSTGAMRKDSVFWYFPFDLDRDPYNSYSDIIADPAKQGSSVDPAFAAGYIGSAYDFENDDSQQINLGGHRLALPKSNHVGLAKHGIWGGVRRHAYHQQGR